MSDWDNFGFYNNMRSACSVDGDGEPTGDANIVSCFMYLALRDVTEHYLVPLKSGWDKSWSEMVYDDFLPVADMIVGDGG